MGIVVDDHLAVRAALLEVELKAALGSHKSCHRARHRLSIGSGKRTGSHSRHGVLDVDVHRHTQFHTGNGKLWRDKVKADSAVALDDVCRMEVARETTVGVKFHALLQPGLEHDALVHDERAAGADEAREVSETLAVGLGRAVDVKVVGVGAGHHSDGGRELVERAVKLVGLNHAQVAGGAQQEVGAVVAQHAAQKGVAPHAAVVQDMGSHTAGRRLAMSAGKAQRARALGHQAEHPGALDDLKAAVTKPAQPLVVGRHGRRIYNKRRLWVAAPVRNQRRVFVKIDVHALGLQGGSQFTGRAVITGHAHPARKEISFEGSHANAAGAHKINRVIFFHYNSILSLTSILR